MGEKGQASSVFNLLIAAVIAIAILVVLMQVLQIIPDFSGGDPTEQAASKVRDGVNLLGTPQIIENVNFKPNTVVSAGTIASKSNALSEGQVCVLISGSAPNETAFRDPTDDGKIIRYDGALNQKVRLVVHCDNSGKVEETLNDSGYADDFEISLDTCSTLDSGRSTKYCVVAVISDI